MIAIRSQWMLAACLCLFAGWSTAEAGGWGLSWFSGSGCNDCEREQWYAARANDPVGARQKYYKGKYWPPVPRPTGPAQLPTHQYHAAHYWPHPYQCQDRAYVRETSKRQTNNGWMAATTLYDYHFDAETHELNRAGEIRLRWVFENAPTDQRIAFVQNGRTTTISQSRMQSTREKASEMVGEANVPPIVLRVCSPLGRPAGEIEQIRNAEMESLPRPRISDPISATGANGGDI
jgi:hypothetical protein